MDEGGFDQPPPINAHEAQSDAERVTGDFSAFTEYQTSPEHQELQDRLADTQQAIETARQEAGTNKFTASQLRVMESLGKATNIVGSDYDKTAAFMTPDLDHRDRKQFLFNVVEALKETGATPEEIAKLFEARERR